MSRLKPFFSGGQLSRQASLRASEGELKRAATRTGTRFLAVRSGACLLHENAPGWLALDEIEAWLQQPLDHEALILLGTEDNQFLFALNLPDHEEGTGIAPPDGRGFLEGRGLLSEFDADTAALLAYTRAMSNWQNNHRYCGRCGSVNQRIEGGFVMQCSNEACATRSFPRLDPAVIVLVHDDERCLLGRQPSWPEGRFSTIAGFAEPGESLEDTLKREVKEETNIDISAVEYLGSQPWPFPAALMIGFHAQATSTDIRLNDQELAEAGWFTREQLREEVILPPQQSIAFQLIADWHDAKTDVALASIPPKAAFNAPRA